MLEAAPAQLPAQAILLMAKRALKAQEARTDLRAFIEYCKPDKDHYDDPECSGYDCWPHHEKIINLFSSACAGNTLRGALSIPPQHGKTTICGEYGIAWYLGNNEEDKIIYGTYSEARAGVVGENVRKLLESERFKDVFPDFEMRKGSKSKDFIGFGKDGSIMFLGRNSGASGNPCDLFIIDDPYKDRREARSAAIRREVWDWYCSVVEARCPIQTPIFIIHTRWSDDDLIGRLCDPTHPEYSADENDQFDYLNIPAIVNDPQLAAELKMEPGGALWPGREGDLKWPMSLLESIRRKNPTVFSAVFMGDPVPPSGDFFKEEMIKPYRRAQLPARLINYAASDHAVSTTKRADSTCMGNAGVDENGELWITEVIWDKMAADKQVEKMTYLVKKYRPLTWWAEADHIAKAIKPFLKKMLRKQRLFLHIEELPKAGDKQQKAASIQAMMSMGMVHLPQDAPWYSRAVAQLLRFDGSEGRPDDFVDFLANLGRGLDKMLSAPREKADPEIAPQTGTMAWIKFASNRDKRIAKKLKAVNGW